MSRIAVNRWFSGLAAFCGALLATTQAASFTAALDRDTIAVGESATLSLTFEGAIPGAVPAVQAPPRVSVRFGRQSHQLTMANGQSRASLSYAYQITATEPGEYTLGPFRVQAGGELLVSEPVKLNVVQGGAAALNQDGTAQLAFLRLIVPKTNVYVGETFVVEVQLFLGVNYDNVEMPRIQGDGFMFGKVPQPNGTRTQIGNRAYVVFPFKMSAVAVKSGRLTLGPAKCSVILQIPVSRRGRDLLEDFLGPRVQRTPVTIASEPQGMEVLSLPALNQPAEFNGAVGSFSIAASASPTNLNTGDPITLRVQISGQGNLESLLFPADPDVPGFKLYPPTSTVEASDPLGLSGVKIFERVVIPLRPDLKQIPPINFSYFDPQRQSYRTASTPPIPIAVLPGPGGQSHPAGLEDSAESGQETSSRDIVHIKPYVGTVYSSPTPLILRPWFLSIHTLPVAFWIAVRVWRWRRERFESNPRLRRRREVDETVRAGIKELTALAEARKAEAFFAVIFRLVQEQLGERLELPSSAITEAVVEEHLRGRASDELVERLHALFQACNQARYGPQRSSAELMSLVPRVEEALVQLRQVPDSIRA